MLVACATCSPSKSPLTYEASGRIVSLGADRHSVIIEHEEIPGFMPAMTMPFSLKDPALLNGLGPNDVVRFTLVVTERDSWISRMEKRGHEEKPRESGRATGTKTKSVLKVGEVVPYFSLTNQDGHVVSPEDFRGKPLAITFIFTRCPLPDYCPRFTGNFVAVQKQLSPRFGDRFRLVSISIDPAHDTPKVLKDYGRQVGADFRSWSFLTGSEDEVERAASHFDVNFVEEAGAITHSAACAVVTASGRLYKIHRGITWTPEQIAADLTTLLTESDNTTAGRD